MNILRILLVSGQFFDPFVQPFQLIHKVGIDYCGGKHPQ